MKRRILAAALAACLLLSGCAALLERSYSLVEPYADRYWDSSAEDTLRVDNYQDLVNSLLMLIEQRTEEAVIRCYDEVSAYQAVARSQREVRWETVQGSYLLQTLQFTFEEGASYGTAAFRMTYREDAEDLSGVMTLSDSQSLVDLLRLAIREEHEKITAQFTYDTPREAVTAAVESCWQELCREEMEAEAAFRPAGDTPDEPPEESGELPPEDGPEEAPEESPEDASSPEELPAPEEADAQPEDPGEAPPDGEAPEDGEVTPEPEPDPIVYPPCPWVIRFYPNRPSAELVEILLNES